MDQVRSFEIEIIRLLQLSPALRVAIDQLIQSSHPFGYQYTGAGYYLTWSAPDLPSEHAIVDEPHVGTWIDGMYCGFMGLAGAQTFALECYVCGDTELPRDFRERDIVLIVEAIGN